MSVSSHIRYTYIYDMLYSINSKQYSIVTYINIYWFVYAYVLLRSFYLALIVKQLPHIGVCIRVCVCVCSRLLATSGLIKGSLFICCSRVGRLGQGSPSLHTHHHIQARQASSTACGRQSYRAYHLPQYVLHHLHHQYHHHQCQHHHHHHDLWPKRAVTARILELW